MKKRHLHFSIFIDNSQETMNKINQGNLQKLTPNIMYKSNKVIMASLNTPIKYYTGSVMQCNKPWKRNNMQAD